MANPTMPSPVILTDPGYLYWAPPGTALPTGVSTASAFSDSWPVAWIPVGMTLSGADFGANTTVAPLVAAESIVPLAYRPTAWAGTLSFQVLGFTATNLARASQRCDHGRDWLWGDDDHEAGPTCTRLGDSGHDRMGVSRQHNEIHRLSGVQLG